MDEEALLQELKDRYGKRRSLSQKDGDEWVARVSELLHLLAPESAAEFDHLTPMLSAPLTSHTLKPLWEKVQGVVRAGIGQVERRRALAPVEEARHATPITADQTAGPATPFEQTTDLDKISVGALFRASARLSLGAAITIGGVLASTLGGAFWLGATLRSGNDVNASGSTLTVTADSLRVELLRAEARLAELGEPDSGLPVEVVTLRERSTETFLGGRGRITPDGYLSEFTGTAPIIVYVDAADTALTLRLNERARVSLSGYTLWLDLLRFQFGNANVAVVIAELPTR
jgi:hypothetical protein